MQRGFSTIEILIAFSVGILFLSSALMIAFSDPVGATQFMLDASPTIALDVVLDNNALASAKNYYNSTIAALFDNRNDFLVPKLDGLYTHAANEVDVSPCVKYLSNTTSWSTQHARSRNIALEGAVSNLSLAQALGKGACDPIPLPSHAWKNPSHSGWSTEEGEIIGTATSINTVVLNDTLYAVVTTTHTNQAHDLWLIDMSDIEHPKVTVSLETGGDTNTRGITEGVVVHTREGIYAYVLQNSSENQLQAIPLSDPDTLDTEDVYTISLAPYGINPLGSNPIPQVIRYFDKKLYIGLRTTIGPEFLVFSTSDNPARPLFEGAVPNGFDHSINDIEVHDGYAFLAIAPGSGSSAKELMVLDVSGNVPKDTGKGFNASSTANDTEAATALYLIGNKLYMGRERVSNALERDLYVFDISSSTLPTPLKSKRLGLSTGGTMGRPRVLDIIVHGRLGFLLTTDTTKSFGVYDVLESSTSLELLTESCTSYLPIPHLVAITYEDGLLFAAHGEETVVSTLHDNSTTCAL